MKKIIVLFGERGVGKTTAIKDVYETLLQNGAIELKKKKLIWGTRNDFEVSLEYKRLKIALFSEGDKRSVLEAAVERYKNKCDIFICALNKKFQNVGVCWISASDSIFKLEKLAKTNADNEEVKNEIVNLIN